MDEVHRTAVLEALTELTLPRLRRGSESLPSSLSDMVDVIKREGSLVFGEEGDNGRDSVGVGERHAARSQPGCTSHPHWD